MATRTLTTTVDPTNVTTGTKQYAKIALRNMDFLKIRDHGSAVIPIRTKNNPSPVKKAASNRQPGQHSTRTTVDEVINHELAKARYLIDDLADHVFGHIVPTELARDILRQFVDAGIIQIFEGAAPRFSDDGKALDSEIVQHAIEQAFEEAAEHGCIRKNAEGDAGGPGPSSVDRQGNQTDREDKSEFADPKGKGKQKQKYLFKWSTFPTGPIDEDELVKFLNKITDDAFNFTQSRFSNVIPRLKHRFAVRKDKHHAMPLSYGPDREDMRPDFLLLPMEAFRDDFKTVDPKYLNFTVSRLVGEAKNKDLAAGVEQVQRYARGLKRAQPWVHYVLAMAITKDRVVFMRGEGSGMERLELMLADGRGCIEFIRILLGLALAEDVDLEQNPGVCLQTEIRTRRQCTPHTATSSNVPSTATTARVKGSTTTGSATNAGSSCVVTSEASSESRSISSRTRSASRAPPITSRTDRAASVASSVLSGASRTRVQRIQTSSTSSASSKRTYSKCGEAGDGSTRRKKRKTTEETVSSEEQVVFFPLRVYSHTCLGILFTSSLIRGRGTTVFCVLDLDDPNKRLTLKMSWQDLERLGDQEAVMKRLQEHKPHRNVIVPLSTFKAQRNDMTCTTLGVIRGFLDEQIPLIGVENRVLTISVSELKRPVAYFWGLHDFVRGLRGALLGHEFLTKIGILHRDVSENNIVLGTYPWEERGYLIDFDLAILLEAERDLSTGDQVHQPAESISAADRDNKKHVKGLRTGTFPYISFSVLLGEEHTHFNDVESFLYVLLLFFFSHAGALSKTDLEDAHRRGFVQQIGSGRLPHLRDWPQTFTDWADGDPLKIAQSKYFYVGNPYGPRFLVESAEMQDCLEKNWPADLHGPIRALLESAFTMFRDGARGTSKGRTEVSHARFVELLDEWLEAHSTLEDEHSNCPDFMDPGSGLDSPF